MNVGAWIAIGAGIGVALGAALDDMAIGIAIGVAIGAAIGAGTQQTDEGEDTMQNENPESGQNG